MHGAKIRSVELVDLGERNFKELLVKIKGKVKNRLPIHTCFLF
jgi:hypothetical protein